MDREAISTSARYAQLEEQHFNGGYFSDAVKAQGEQFKNLSKEEKRAFFADTFNAVHTAAEQVQAHPRFSGEAIDLTEEGLGVITVSLTEYTPEEIAESGDEDDYPHKGVMVLADSFNPTPERREEWINHPDDPLGLETAAPTMVTVDAKPKDWGEHIYADPDGSFHDSNGHYSIDTEIMRLLDAMETLDVAVAVLESKHADADFVSVVEVTEATAVLRSPATGNLYGIALNCGPEGEQAEVTELEG